MHQLLAQIGNEPFLAELSQIQQDKLAKLAELLQDANQTTNLTAVRDYSGIVRQHFADSCAIFGAIAQKETLTFCDLGTGAGFPLLPLAIARPEWRGTGIESVAKKTSFIKSVAAQLSLDNIQVLTERGEETAQGTLRESFDLAVSRAVGSVAGLSEVLLPLLKVGGRAVLYKTETVGDELEAARGVIELLGGGEVSQYNYGVDGESTTRTLIIIEKAAVSPPQYPRRVGVPFRKPLK